MTSADSFLHRLNAITWIVTEKVKGINGMSVKHHHFTIKHEMETLEKNSCRLYKIVDTGHMGFPFFFPPPFLYFIATLSTLPAASWS